MHPILTVLLWRGITRTTEDALDAGVPLGVRVHPVRFDATTLDIWVDGACPQDLGNVCATPTVLGHRQELVVVLHLLHNPQPKLTHIREISSWAMTPKLLEIHR